MKITDDVREYAKEQGYGVDEALTAGMEKASFELFNVSRLAEGRGLIEVRGDESSFLSSACFMSGPCAQPLCEIK